MWLDQWSEAIPGSQAVRGGEGDLSGEGAGRPRSLMTSTFRYPRIYGICVQVHRAPLAGGVPCQRLPSVPSATTYGAVDG